MGVTTSREEEERDECRARPSASLAELDNRPETPPLLADGRAQSDGNLDGIVPTPFTWGYGGQSVYVTGAWDDWRVKVALSPVSGREFSAVLALPLGYHQYKFIVDGNWKHSPALPAETDQHGNLNNFVNVQPQVPEYDSNEPLDTQQRSSSPIESYNFSMAGPEVGEPPGLPRLLSEVPIDSEEKLNGTGFVHLNHMFCTDSDRPYNHDGVRTLATVHRHNSKSVTTIMVIAKQPPSVIPIPGSDMGSTAISIGSHVSPSIMAAAAGHLHDPLDRV